MLIFGYICITVYGYIILFIIYNIMGQCKECIYISIEEESLKKLKAKSRNENVNL